MQATNLQMTEMTRYRQLKGWTALIWNILLALIPITGILYILSLHIYLGIPLYGQQLGGLFLALVLASVFMGVPASKKSIQTRVPWYDWMFSLFGLIVGLYIAIYYPDILLNFTTITPLKIVLGTLAILLIFEGIRRLYGWSLVIIVSIFLMYAFVAPFMPGAFQGQKTPLKQLINYLYLDTTSLLDFMYLAATMGLAFILFGQVLLSFGGAEIFSDLAMRLFGKYRGGPAKIAVAGSSAVGSIVGTPVANVMLTGNMTIPLMVKTGYTRAQAGAIEAVAATGGTILPPVMGVVAFVMAQNLGVPYKEVALAALIPAILYYVCLFIQVDLHAAQNGAGKLSKDELPPLALIRKRGWLLAPIFFTLIYLLFVKGYPPATAGLYTSGVALVCLLLQKWIWPEVLSRLIVTLIESGKTLLEIGIVLCAAGLMVGIISITGLGFNLVLALTQFGQQGLFVLLVACAIVCIILGMGMPAIAAYSIVALLIAPSLVELSVTPMAAHMFVLFFANVSNFTPPIALASFAAAPIAQESPYKISVQAMKLGIVSYVIPFVFVYNPSLLLSTNLETEIVDYMLSIVGPVFACIVLPIGLVGYLFRPLGPVKRILMIVLAFVLFWPLENQNIKLLMNGMALIVFAVLFLVEWKKNRQKGLARTNVNHVA